MMSYLAASLGAWSGIAHLWVQSWHLRLRGMMAMVLSAITEVQLWGALQHLSASHGVHAIALLIASSYDIVDVVSALIFCHVSQPGHSQGC